MHAQTIFLLRVSSVVPAKPTPSKPTHYLNDRDIAMKRHYIRAVYYFRKRSVDNTCNGRLKAGLSESLMEYSVAAGRLDLGADGRPYIRCNDAGVRFVEAAADVKLEEWKDLKDSCCLEADLTQIQETPVDIIPLVIIQITRFQCGGVAIGLSWSHVLGGASSASHFMRAWAECCRRSSELCLPTCGHGNSSELLLKQSGLASNSKQNPRDLFVGMQNRGTIMELASFRISNAMVEHFIIDAQMSKHSNPETPFVAISSFVWRSILKPCPQRVVICRESNNITDPNVTCFYLGNDQILSQVQLLDEQGMELGSTASLSKIAELIQNADQTISMDKDETTLFYGHDLTFVNWEQLPWYDMVLEEESPIHVSCTAEPVGVEGMVIVMPSSSEEENARLVKVFLHRDEVVRLREDLFQYSTE